MTQKQTTFVYEYLLTQEQSISLAQRLSTQEENS